MQIEFEWNDLVDLVNDASSDDINRIAHAISDIINVLNSGNVNDVDLSNYYTKEEVDNKDNELQQGVEFVLGQIANFQFDLDLKENLSNKTNTIGDAPSEEKYPSESAVYGYGLQILQQAVSYVDAHLETNYYDKNETKDEINAAIQLAIGDVLGGAS